MNWYTLIDWTQEGGKIFCVNLFYDRNKVFLATAYKNIKLKKNRLRYREPSDRRSSLSINALHACVYIFTSGSSALLGRPRCGLSIWLSLVAIFNTLFWVYANFVHWKRSKCDNTRSLTIFVWYENGRRQLVGAQSINTERVSWTVTGVELRKTNHCVLWLLISMLMAHMNRDFNSYGINSLHLSLTINKKSIRSISSC